MKNEEYNGLTVPPNSYVKLWSNILKCDCIWYQVRPWECNPMWLGSWKRRHWTWTQHEETREESNYKSLFPHPWLALSIILENLILLSHDKHNTRRLLSCLPYIYTTNYYWYLNSSYKKGSLTLIILMVLRGPDLLEFSPYSLVDRFIHISQNIKWYKLANNMSLGYKKRKCLEVTETDSEIVLITELIFQFLLILYLVDLSCTNRWISLYTSLPNNFYQ